VFIGLPFFLTKFCWLKINLINQPPTCQGLCRFDKDCPRPSQRYRDIDGGAAAGALPQFLFGDGPISKTSLPPLAMSAWLNHG
jgi:hypothetical protein